MADLVLIEGGVTETVTPGRRDSIGELAAILRQDGHSVEVQIKERRPGLRTLNWGESVAIFVVSGVATTLISVIVADIYQTVKSWARERYRKRHRNLRVRIYDSDRKLLISLTMTFVEGEREEIFIEIPCDLSNDSQKTN